MRARRPGAPVAAALLVAGLALLAAWPASAAQPVRPGEEESGAEEAPVGDPDDDDLVAEGRELFLTGCSGCHGIEGQGVEDRGPSLENAGQAAAYYYLTTGRMPLANPREVPRRKDPAYADAEIEALVAYVATLAPEGAEVPEVQDDGDLAEGGELYRESCAPCHSAGGIGGALSYGRAAPTVHSAEPLQIGAAVRAGPGQMPRFGQDVLTNAELDDIVRYVGYIGSPENPGGAALGQAGPIPEGFVAWVFGAGTLLLAAVWIGTRQVRRR